MEESLKPKLVEDLGMRQITEFSIQKKRFGLYECPYCGKEFEAQTPSINSGNTKSCGCLKPANRNKEGRPTKQEDVISDSKIKLYGIYNFMKARCYNTSTKQFKDYGGRGIKVWESWLSNFDEFYDWAISSGYLEGLTLDRITIDGDYTPSNCRWVNRNIQAQNTRHNRENNTSGFRGVSYHKPNNRWVSYINLEGIRINLGYYATALEAAKAYERYVRLNNLEHNFTPALTEGEIKELRLSKV